MKYIMNIQWLLLFIMIMSSNAFSQGIRKDYTEMTDDERIALMSAYWELGNDQNQNGPLGGLVGEIGDFHRDNFSDIHFNQRESDVFFAWHRQASVELQRAMKNELDNEWITIPYWDWTLSNSKSDALWGNNWIGPFNSAWGLNRSTFDSGGFPTQSDIDNALTETDFYTFSRSSVEQNPIHSWGHIWTGGTMSGGDSPKDPTFFFHHNMVDKIWAEWHDDETKSCPNNDCYVKTNMPRYDGTETNALGESLPSVDPDDIVDPRSLGIFYSDRANSLTTLNRYTVSNISTSSEKFGYQYKIEAMDDFLVPSGNDAEFRSCNVIELLPGFEAANGSDFHAFIGGCDISGERVGEEIIDNELMPLRNYPNPFTGQTTIEFTLSKDTPVTLFVSDAMGRQIAVLLNNDQKTEGIHSLTFDGNEYPAGMYYYTIQAGEYYGTQKMILAK